MYSSHHSLQVVIYPMNQILFSCNFRRKNNYARIILPMEWAKYDLENISTFSSLLDDVGHGRKYIRNLFSQCEHQFST